MDQTEAEFNDGLLTPSMLKLGAIPVKIIAVKPKAKKEELKLRKMCEVRMIDLPTKAEVYCSDGIAGLSTYVIGNPINHQVTHLVVKSLKPPSREYLVPFDVVRDTTPQQIKLKCTRDEIEKMKPFSYEEYIPITIPSYLVWSYFIPGTYICPANEDEEPVYSKVKILNVPPGELALSCGAKVQANDGYIGQVNELLINSKNMQVCHLVLRVRLKFEQREITIPVSQIDRVDEDTIYLKLDSKSVETLPTTPIQRWSLSENQSA